MVKLSPKLLSLVAGGAGAVAIATQFLGEKEGLSLTSYQDGARVWTICRGQTKGVQPNQVMTMEDCDRFFATDIGKAFAEADRVIKVPMTEPRRAAVVSFCFYNLGQPRCRKTGFIARLNAGDPGACSTILDAMSVDGKDCRDPKNKCGGIPIRREQEYQLCLL